MQWKSNTYQTLQEFYLQAQNMGSCEKNMKWLYNLLVWIVPFLLWEHATELFLAVLAAFQQLVHLQVSLHGISFSSQWVLGEWGRNFAISEYGIRPTFFIAFKILLRVREVELEHCRAIWTGSAVQNRSETKIWIPCPAQPGRGYKSPLMPIITPAYPIQIRSIYLGTLILMQYNIINIGKVLKAIASRVLLFS